MSTTSDIKISANDSSSPEPTSVTIQALTHGPVNHRMSMTLDVDQTRDVIRRLTAALTMLGFRVEPPEVP